ncbi:MAG: hypothetical protein IKF90_02110 [Parasporobacterium sp.]|nr:hypothetical protein [Parasporobacterium sp.]
MYHFYKIFGDSEYEERLKNSFKKEAHSVTTQIHTLVTFSPGFLRNELESGLSILGVEEGDSPDWSDLMALDAFVINPLLDLLYESVKVDRIGARLAAEEMIDVLSVRESCEDFPERQIELLKSAARIKM